MVHFDHFDLLSLKKGIYIYFYFQGYENSKGLGIIQDFTAHWAIKNKEMANVWTFDLESESSQVSYYDIESNCVTSVHVSSKKMIDILFYFKWYESSEGLAII